MHYPMRDEGYYQNLHENSTGYQANNWLCGEIDIIRKIGGSTIAEFGCGNGDFLLVSAKYFDEVHGYDWAESPRIRQITTSKIRFEKVDLTQGFPDVHVDIAASADFLEHLTINDVRDIVPRLHTCARYNYHKIACYDDGHSHQTIMTPSKWRRVFKEQSLEYHILYTQFRGETKNRLAKNKLVCVITNWRPKWLLFVPSRLRRAILSALPRFRQEQL